MDWGALLIAVITGGVGVAIVNAIANRKRVQTDCIKSLGEAYEARLLALNTQVSKLDAKILSQDEKIDSLEAEVDVLRGEKKEREDTIENLKRENAELTAQVEKLQAAIGRRDKRIRELEKQVTVIPELEAKIADLTDRLDAMGNEEGWVGGTD